MRKLLLPVLILLSAAPIGMAATGKTSRAAVLTQATGDIGQLGLSRITVGHTTCSVPATMHAVGRFVIGDPVSIGCKGSVLKTIKYAPPGSAATTSLSTTVIPIVPSGTPASTGPITNFSAAWSSITISSSASSQSSDPMTISATGTITAFDETGITIEDAKCPFPTVNGKSVLFQDILPLLQVVGKTGSMSCSASGSNGKFSTSH